MRRALSPLALAFAFALTLGSSGIAAAAPLSFRVYLGDHAVGIGLGGVTLYQYGSSWLHKCDSSNCVDVPLLYATASLTSGPLLEFHVTYDPVTLEPLTTRYNYADGTFGLDVEWEGSGGVRRKGTFSAPVGGFDLLFVEVGGAFAPKAEAILYFGPGLLSRNLAKHLGVGRHTTGGDFNFWPESIDGDPFDAERIGGLNDPTINIDLVPEPVPEPGLAALALLSLAGVLVQRRRRGSSKTP